MIELLPTADLDDFPTELEDEHSSSAEPPMAVHLGLIVPPLGTNGNAGRKFVQVRTMMASDCF